MSEIPTIKNQTIISVLPEEISFFEQFTKQKRINWPAEQKDNGLLILSASMVGYIVTPLREIKLPIKYPEITFSHILRMYMYLYTFRKNDDARELDVTENSDDLDIAQSFLSELRQQIGDGIVRDYHKYRVMERNLKGEVNWIKTYQNILLHRTFPVDTKTFQLSTDIPINRLIVGALQKISHANSYAAEAQDFLNYFVDVKNPVTENGAQALAQIVFNSNTNRYRKTLNYAAMIIDNTDYDDLGNNTSLKSFLLNFDALYEDFVVKVLTEESGSQGFSTWKRMHNFDESEGIANLTYKPDILYQYLEEDPDNNYKESAFAILDCKNKAHSVFKNADVYQVISYSRKLNAKKTLLLYPSFFPRETDALYLDYELFDPDVIYAVFVNIANNSGTEFMESIRSFAKRVVKILNS